MTQTEYFMTADGSGTGAPAESITTSQTWDGSNRLTSRTDGNTNVTTHSYDALNRLVATTHADTTVHTHTYDMHDNRLTETDANTSVQTSVYDLNNRLAGRTIARAPGVLGTTAEGYMYDGRTRVVSATDDDSTVTRSYDSLSRVTTETLNGQTSTSLYDGVGNQLTGTYPGGRVITCTYDALDRKATISDGGGLLATYDYIGPYRVERRQAGPAAAVTESTYGWDGIRRMTASTHRNILLPGMPIFDDRNSAWNQMSNNILRANVLTGVTRDYEYDSIYRLVQAIKNPGASVIDYLLDDVGDRVTVTGGPAPGPYTKNPTLPEPADAQMNQYTTTPTDGRRYDRNGNLRFIDFGTPNQRNLNWNYRNLLVRHVDTATVPGTRTDYRYDALGRRTEKIVDVLGTPVTTRFFYDGRFVIEEQDGAGLTTATYVEGVGP